MYTDNLCAPRKYNKIFFVLRVPPVRDRRPLSNPRIIRSVILFFIDLLEIYNAGNLKEAVKIDYQKGTRIKLRFVWVSHTGPFLNLLVSLSQGLFEWYTRVRFITIAAIIKKKNDSLNSSLL